MGENYQWRLTERQFKLLVGSLIASWGVIFLLVLWQLLEEIGVVV